MPLIFDEVITGFRLARGGAQEFYGVDADLTVLGKGLGAGAPMGAVAGSETLMAWLQTGRPDGKRILGEGSSYGNALAASAALAQMRELARPGTYERFHGMGKRLADRLGEQFSQYGHAPQFVSAGPVIEFYFGEGPFLDYASAQASDQRVKRALAQGLRSRGVFGGGGRYNISLSHGEAEIDVLVSAVEDVLQELAHATEDRLQPKLVAARTGYCNPASGEGPPAAPNEVWAMYFNSDRLFDGRRTRGRLPETSRRACQRNRWHCLACNGG